MQKNSLNYPVEFVSGIFDESPILADLVGAGKLLIVADYNLVQCTGGLGLQIGRYVKAHDITMSGQPVIIGGGEKAKMDNFVSLRRILSAAVFGGLGPDDTILVLGGGAVMDVAGYAAAQVRGGVGLVRIPTTPAAMLDAAFATAAALNTQEEKDVLRLPSVPKAVLIDTVYAKTVLDGVWCAGIGEAVRLGVAKDAAFLKKVATYADGYAAKSEAVFSELVEGALAVRKKKGATDLGLAVAAALEPKSNWKLPHGYAVPLGVLTDLLAAVKAGEVKEEVLKTAHEIMKKCKALDGLYHSRHILPPELSVFW